MHQLLAVMSARGTYALVAAPCAYARNEPRNHRGYPAVNKKHDSVGSCLGRVGAKYAKWQLPFESTTGPPLLPLLMACELLAVLSESGI